MPANPDLLVLSYNVSHESMTNSSGGTAGPLGAKCVPVSKGSRLTVCAQRMGRTIDGIPAAVGLPNLGLVGLQESSRWRELVGAAPGTLGHLTPVANEIVKKASMVSFYDASRFTLKHTPILSQLAPTPDGHPTGRPILILIFEENVVFVNVHNDHSFSFDGIAARLDESLRAHLSGDEISALKGFRVIVTGDFNNAARGLTGSTVGWTPFAHGPIASVSLDTPPITCCRQEGDWTQPPLPPTQDHQGDANRPGDFVFDSASTPTPIVPPNYDDSLLQSDHRPVIATLPG